MNTQATSTPDLRLIGSRRSPYVRKVLIFAAEIGLAPRVELVPIVVNFRKVEREASNPHPLNQVPTLIAPDGMAIYDSDVICSWLAEQAGADALALFDGPRGRFEVAIRQSLAQSMIDVQMRLFSERTRDADGAESDVATGARARLHWGLDALEQDRDGWMQGAFDIGQVTAAAMLSYMDLRHADLGWRAGRPALASWYAAVAARPSMLASEYRI